MALKIISFLLTSLKCELGEVEKAMLQGLAFNFYFIFGLLNIPKCDLFEVVIPLFRGLAWHF